MGQDVRNPLLARLKEALLVRGATEAAKRLDMARSFLDDQDTSGIQSLARRHCREYGLDQDWILRGQGQDSPVCDPVALTPVFAMASPHPHTGRWQLCEIERIALAPSILGPSRFVTRMDSHALEPSIRLGAYLVVDTDQQLPPATSGQAERGGSESVAPFAVDMRGEGLLVRMARYDTRTNRLELSAPAWTAPPMVVSRDVAHCRVVGRVVWVAQTL